MIDAAAFKGRNAVRLCLFAGLLAGMVGVASAFGEREIIFPEIAAVLTGFVLAPRLPWRLSLPRMVVTFAVCALLGTLVSMYVPCHIALKMTLAYALALAVLKLSGTTAAPMISAAVLPVLFGTRGFVYLASATVLVAICAVLRYFLERCSFARKELMTSHPGVWGGWRMDAVRIAVVLCLTFVAAGVNCLFLAAPPLLVAFTQMTRRTNPVRKMPGLVVVGVFACSAIGIGCRMLLPAFPTLAAFATALLIGIFFISFRFYFPPVAAMGILAFLVPESQMLFYPVAATAGMGILCFITQRENRLLAKRTLT